MNFVVKFIIFVLNEIKISDEFRTWLIDNLNEIILNLNNSPHLLSTKIFEQFTNHTKTLHNNLHNNLHDNLHNNLHDNLNDNLHDNLHDISEIQSSHIEKLEIRILINEMKSIEQLLFQLSSDAITMCHRRKLSSKFQTKIHKIKENDILKDYNIDNLFSTIDALNSIKSLIELQKIENEIQMKVEK
tara:strand:- start:3998 stop:4558 length:561 start_codon:yes stop_codon:yes gene_type:complete